MNMRASYSSEQCVYDALVTDAGNLRGIKATVPSGNGELLRGSLMGKVTASGKYILSLAAAGDGSEVPVGILAEDVDATASDAEVMMYVTGDFLASEMTFGTGHTSDSVKDVLHDRGIYLQ